MVIKVNVFLTNIADFGAVNEVYAKYFNKNLPARSCVQVPQLPKPEAKVEIELTAFAPGPTKEESLKFLN